MLPLLLLALAPLAVAQSPQGGPDDPLARYLFPPELVMAHQTAINLTDAQRGAIQKAVKEAQGKFIDVQFSMSAEAEKLQRLLSAPTADETKVLAQVDQVLTMEREVKKAQITLLVRIKNQLTPDQQEQLSKLRKQDPPRPWAIRKPTPSSDSTRQP
jgi:Spy/CpxP family protein refolding chaperone